MRSVGLGISSRATSQEFLRRLAQDSRDAQALIALYEDQEVEIRAAAIRWFGKNRKLSEQAVHNILVAIGRQARTYNPQSMEADDWVRGCANAEARRLREVLDRANSRGVRARRAM